MPSMKNTIDAHNKSIINNQVKPPPKTCNCRRKEQCPMNGRCKEECLVYQAVITTKNSDETETYVGLCATDFKTRYNNHKSSFAHPHKRKETELRKNIWSLKDSKKEFHIKWKILKHASPYSNATKRCNLCLLEIFYLIYKPRESSLNKRSELMSTCRHSSKFLLNSKRTNTKKK